MADSICIALDAMGGDHAPEAIIAGAALALKRSPEVRFLVFGDQNQLQPLLDRRKKLAAACEVVHTDQRVRDDEKPARALRQRGTSMRMMLDAVKSGQADGAVTAGNTGALMGLAYLMLRTLPGIDRPAMASFFPTFKGESCMLDLGANLQCDADNLVQFGIMGNVFARLVLGTRYPTMGLLNVGSESTKGSEALQEAHRKLSKVAATHSDNHNQVATEPHLPGQFVGFIEGHDIAAGKADVVITDGFTGNVALKMGEGTASLSQEFIRQAFKASIFAKIGFLFASRTLRKLRYRLDPRRYNGAMLLGLNGVVVKSHGGSDYVGFANALALAIDLIKGQISKQIRDEWQSIEPLLD